MNWRRLRRATGADVFFMSDRVFETFLIKEFLLGFRAYFLLGFTTTRFELERLDCVWASA